MTAATIKPFRLDPSNCVVDITVYAPPGTDSIHILTFSSLQQSLKLSKDLLDDIERKAIVAFVMNLLEKQFLKGIDVSDEAYCAALAEALGIERMIVRVKVHKEQPPPPKKGPAMKGKLSAAVAQLSDTIVNSINAETNLKAAEAELGKAFEGTSATAFDAWAAKMQLHPEQIEEMRAIWHRANQ